MNSDPLSPTSPQGCHWAAGWEPGPGRFDTSLVGPQVAPPSCETDTNASLLWFAHGSTGRPVPGSVAHGPPLRKSVQNTVNLPLASSIPIAGKSFRRYPLGDRHCRKNGQPVAGSNGEMRL